MTDYDLVVIGSGPAGERGAAQAAQLGKRVAIVELQEKPGGACANTGTLPSKTLRESALYLSGLRQREIYGVECSVHTEGLSVAHFMVHKEMVVAREHERILSNLQRHNIELVVGRGSLIDAHTVEVVRDGWPTRRLTTAFVLLATGSYPYRPPGIPFQDDDVDDSDEVLQLPKIPQSVIVVGGGVIGSEYASIFAALGVTKVSLIETKARLLSFLDSEISERITEALRRLGVDIHLGEEVAEYEKQPGGRGVRIRLKESGQVLEAERLLVAAGRTGNTRGLGLENVGVVADNRGRICVNEQFQTNVANIYAAGDVVGFPSLASVSMEQGRVAACHAFAAGPKQGIAPLLPYGLYTIPEAAMVGETEESARQKGFDVEVGRSHFCDNARGQIVNDPDGLLKLVFDAGTRHLLGIHVVGERATELVHVGQAVLTLGGTIDYFVDAVFNYPTLSEAYKHAAYDGLARLAQRTGVHYDTVEATLVDVEAVEIA